MGIAGVAGDEGGAGSVVAVASRAGWQVPLIDQHRCDVAARGARRVAP